MAVGVGFVVDAGAGEVAVAALGVGDDGVAGFDGVGFGGAGAGVDGAAGHQPAVSVSWRNRRSQAAFARWGGQPATVTPNGSSWSTSHS